MAKYRCILKTCGLWFVCLAATNLASANPYVSPESVDNTGLVSTPYGLLPKSDVVEVNKSEVVKVLPNHHVVVANAATQAVIKDYGLIPEGYDSNPYTHAAKLRQEYFTKSGLTPATAGTALSDTDIDGYYTDASVQNIRSFSTTWVVPAIPKDPEASKTFFLWNGLSGGGLQPVLQWGNNNAHYAIANWAFVKNYFHGQYIQVDPGTQLTGVIQLQSQDNDGWHYKESFSGYPDADLYVVRPTEANDVVECFESYTSDPDQIPSNLYTSMDNISLSLYSGTLPSSLQWTAHSRHSYTPSGHNIVVVNDSPTDGRLDIYFH